MKQDIKVPKYKILTVNWSKDEGSIAKIIRDIETELSGKCIFFHCYQVGKKSEGRNYRVAPWNLTRFYYLLARIIGIKYGLGIFPTLALIRYIKKTRPDLVHIHCPNFYSINLYMLFEFLKKEKFPVLITNHAEFFYTGNCAHAVECNKYMTGCQECNRVFDTVHRYFVNRTEYEWRKMKNAFCHADTFAMCVVSRWQMRRIKKSPIVEGIPIYLIENCVDTSIFRYKEVRSQSRCENQKNMHTILHVTSYFSDDMNDLKGGYYLIELAKRLSDFNFLVAGNVNLNNRNLLPKNVELLGNVGNPEKLAEYYNLADVTVLTSKRETFGMACAESLACGTPVAAFEAGGTESIAIQDFCSFVPFGNIEALGKAVYNMIALKAKGVNAISKAAHDKYSIEKMADKYYKLYKEMIKDNV